MKSNDVTTAVEEAPLKCDPVFSHQVVLVSLSARGTGHEKVGAGSLG